MNENFIKKSNCGSNILNNAINEINKNKLKILSCIYTNNTYTKNSHHNDANF